MTLDQALTLIDTTTVDELAGLTIGRGEQTRSTCSRQAALNEALAAINGAIAQAFEAVDPVMEPGDVTPDAAIQRLGFDMATLTWTPNATAPPEVRQAVRDLAAI